MKHTLRLPVAGMACALALAACGGSSSSSTGAGTNSDPATLMSGATNSLKNAKSVHMKANLNSGGRTIGIDADVVGPDFGGDMSSNGTSFHVTSTGGMFYITNAASFLQANVPAAVALVPDNGNGCLSFNSSTPGIGQAIGGIAQLTNLSGLSSGLPAAGSVTAGGDTTVNGVSGTVLKASDGSTVVVSKDSPPVLLELKSSQGSIDFTNYNSASSVTAPTGCVDLSAVLGGASPSPS